MATYVHESLGLNEPFTYFEIDTTHKQHIYFYLTREYYPDPPIPTPEPKDYGFTVKYLGQD